MDDYVRAFIHMALLRIVDKHLLTKNLHQDSTKKSHVACLYIYIYVYVCFSIHTRVHIWSFHKYGPVIHHQSISVYVQGFHRDEEPILYHQYKKKFPQNGHYIRVIYIYVYMYVHKWHIHTYMCISMSVCTRTHIHIHICICTHICPYT